jgi:hypothetical protein
MSELIIRFPSLSEMLDFIATTGYLDRKIVQEHCSICGFFSDAEIELAQNGMHGEIKPLDKTQSGPQ